MKFWVATAIAVASIASLCEARNLCGEGPVATPTITPSTTTPAPFPTTTTTPQTAAPVAPAPTTALPATPAPSTTAAPSVNFYIKTSETVVNTLTAAEIPLGKCISLGCWRKAISYEWDIIGAGDTTISFFTAAECNLDTLASQNPVYEAGSVPYADSITYQSFVILPTRDAPTDSDITSKKFMCQQK